MGTLWSLTSSREVGQASSTQQIQSGAVRAGLLWTVHVFVWNCFFAHCSPLVLGGRHALGHRIRNIVNLLPVFLCRPDNPRFSRRVFPRPECFSLWPWPCTTWRACRICPITEEIRVIGGRLLDTGVSLVIISHYSCLRGKCACVELLIVNGGEYVLWKPAGPILEYCVCYARIWHFAKSTCFQTTSAHTYTHHIQVRTH